MLKFKNILYCLFLLVTLGRGATLEEVIKQSIYSNPQLRASIASYEASQYELERSYAGNRPTLDVRGEIGEEQTKIAYSFEGSRTLNERQLSLVGRYNLFEGDKTSHKIEEKRASLKGAQNRILEKLNTLSMSMIKVYLELLRRKALLEIEEQNYQNHLETLERVRLRLEAGDGYESDYRQTKARVKLAEGNRLIAKRHYLNAITRYQRFLGLAPDTSTMQIPTVFLKTDTLALKESLAVAKDKNLNLQIQKSQIEEAHALYKEEKSKEYPTLDLELSQSWNNNVHGFEGRDNSQKLAVVLNYNLYNGGADQASQLSALKQTQEQEEKLADIELDVEEEVRLWLMKYELLAEQLELNREQLSYLKGTQELYELEYQNSKRTIIDILNIKQEYSYAEAQKINAQYDQLLAYYQYKKSIGELLDELHIDMRWGRE